MRINYHSFFAAKGGYGNIARSMVGLMNYIPEIDVKITDFGQPARELQHLYQKDPKDRKGLCHQVPGSYPGFPIYYTVTEFDQPPYRSISPMRSAELLLTQSNFCKEVFEDTCHVDTKVIHYPMNPKFKPTGPTYKFTPNIHQFKFKFLSVFEWTHRKDPYTLIKAFAEEFDKDEDVCLLLRTWSNKENVQKWLGALGKDANIFWLPQQVNQMAPLYRACDAYVSATQGEGFGQPFAEAMGCGLKVIAPKSTGMLDFCTTKNSLLVETEEKAIKDTRSFGYGGIEKLGLIQPWFKAWEVNEESLREKMRKAQRNEMKFIKDNAVKISNTYSYDNTIKEIKEAFDL